MTQPPKTPLAIAAEDVPERLAKTSYPEPFAHRIAGRHKRPLGDFFGLKGLGINHTVLDPGAESALLHIHTASDEMVYVLDGHPTLITDEGEVELAPGMCAGFTPNGLAHHIVNRTDKPVTLLEIGDRPPDDAGHYPDDDLKAVRIADGYLFTRSDGTPY